MTIRARETKLSKHARKLPGERAIENKKKTKQKVSRQVLVLFPAKVSLKARESGAE